jgi:hypothetical protein
VAGWFLSTTSRMTKQEKRGQADMLLQAHEAQPTDRAGNPIKALNVIFLSHGKESGMGLVQLFAVTLQTAVTPILRSVGYHLQRLYRALVWALNAGVVDGSRRVGALLVQVRARGWRRKEKAGPGIHTPPSPPCRSHALCPPSMHSYQADSGL